MPRAETQAANAAKVRRARRIMAAGESQRAAAKAIGMDEGQLRRALKASAMERKAKQLAKGKKARRAPSVPPGADSSSAGRREKGGGERRNLKSASPTSALTGSRRPPAFHLTLVGLPVGEGTALIKARSAARGCLLPIEATLRKAFRASLAGMTKSLALASLKERRAHVWRSQVAEVATMRARADAERWARARLDGALRTLDFRHQNHWIAENRLRRETLASTVNGIVSAAPPKRRFDWGAAWANRARSTNSLKPDALALATGP